MATAELAYIQSSTGRRAVTTTAASDALFASDRSRHEQIDQPGFGDWQEVVEKRLDLWRLHTDEFEDEGLEAPSEQAIHRAKILATVLHKFGFSLPARIVADGEGGLVFEYDESIQFNDLEPNDAASFMVSKSGAMEFIAFRSGQLVTRRNMK